MCLFVGAPFNGHNSINLALYSRCLLRVVHYESAAAAANKSGDWNIFALYQHMADRKVNIMTVTDVHSCVLRREHEL